MVSFWASLGYRVSQRLNNETEDYPSSTLSLCSDRNWVLWPPWLWCSENEGVGSGVSDSRLLPHRYGESAFSCDVQSSVNKSSRSQNVLSTEASNTLFWCTVGKECVHTEVCSVSWGAAHTEQGRFQMHRNNSKANFKAFYLECNRWAKLLGQGLPRSEQTYSWELRLLTWVRWHHVNTVDSGQQSFCKGETQPLIRFENYLYHCPRLLEGNDGTPAISWLGQWTLPSGGEGMLLLSLLSLLTGFLPPQEFNQHKPLRHDKGLSPIGFWIQ